MVKKLFALASVTALAGLVSAVGAAGCTETVEVPRTADAGTPDAKSKPDAAPGDDDDDDEEPRCCARSRSRGCGQEGRRTTAGACTAAEREQDDRVLHQGERHGTGRSRPTVARKSARRAPRASSARTPTPRGRRSSMDVGRQAPRQQGGCIGIASGKESCGKPPTSSGDLLPRGLSSAQVEEEFDACRKDAQADRAVQGGTEALGPSAGPTSTPTRTRASTKWTFEGPSKSQCVGEGRRGGRPTRRGRHRRGSTRTASSVSSWRRRTHFWSSKTASSISFCVSVWTPRRLRFVRGGQEGPRGRASRQNGE